MITNWIEIFQQWMERKQKRRNALEEARGYEYARELFWNSVPENIIEQEIENNIFDNNGGHFEKGMLGFLRNVKEMTPVYQVKEEDREIRGYGYE